jgi:uncharacterized coiled-coil protein SlyX
MTYADAAHNAALMTGLERAYEARIEELERRLAEMEAMYDKVAADLIEALDVASAYRATASTLHQEVERRNGVERRENRGIYSNRKTTSNALRGRTASEDRRKSWPR